MQTNFLISLRKLCDSSFAVVADAKINLSDEKKEVLQQ